MIKNSKNKIQEDN